MARNGKTPAEAIQLATAEINNHTELIEQIKGVLANKTSAPTGGAEIQTCHVTCNYGAYFYYTTLSDDGVLSFIENESTIYTEDDYNSLVNEVVQGSVVLCNSGYEILDVSATDGNGVDYSYAILYYNSTGTIVFYIPNGINNFSLHITED